MVLLVCCRSPVPSLRSTSGPLATVCFSLSPSSRASRASGWMLVPEFWISPPCLPMWPSIPSSRTTAALLPFVLGIFSVFYASSSWLIPTSLFWLALATTTSTLRAALMVLAFFLWTSACVSCVPLPRSCFAPRPSVSASRFDATNSLGLTLEVGSATCHWLVHLQYLRRGHRPLVSLRDLRRKRARGKPTAHRSPRIVVPRTRENPQLTGHGNLLWP
eukprot:SAG31_NODE_8130_length_1515_cov_7.445621_1_plen_218_part_00